MQRHIKAFTLIELTIVLLIIAVSITVVIPRFTSSSDPRALLLSNIKRIASITEYAYQQAACTGLTHFLNIDCEKGTYWITNQGLKERDRQAIDRLKLKGRLPDGVKFEQVKMQDIIVYDIAAIRLNPQGWADPAEIIMTCSTGEVMSIVIDEFSGQIQTCRIGGLN
ncbi:MAG: type II secretion system protein [Sedimentisphaerales bacterium]|nr:type II secretion system protein [Sedimentisphaerales bacterium]